MLQHAFSAVLVCVVPQPAAVTCWEEANWGRVVPTALHSAPVLQHPSAPPVAVREVGTDHGDVLQYQLLCWQPWSCLWV